ncbi:tripartite tricarboxylate transporter permease [Bosea caraganae]|uniref:Tripartite tricarboxylate transporter permease n=1 Tax=Bosea caraganae TaxID=2763117 RepID=A0A370L9L1_9HYPH|nr:tripartite tricarboxylate transporter permease [Bosea caraganae]RDJ26936.1 tripartite tricarboxylate transporter permease [Bosea caraganae]RDJ30823.1 tripartite tricarboxylate transporter permease [Bosea caraganae]
MDLINNLLLGFSVSLTAANLLYALIGCVVGTLVGVLPGVGALATIAMLLPITYGMAPASGLIMLAGIYYGAQYGGSISAILVNLPGETSSVVTTIDGHQMAKRGRAGAALAISALGSFFAGTVATLAIAAFAGPMSNFAFHFGPAENFALMTVGLVGAVVISSGALSKAVAMVILGLLLGLVGTDINTGTSRFASAFPELTEGFSVVAVAVGLFGLPEIISNLERGNLPERILVPFRSLWPSRTEMRRMVAPMVRGTAIGSLLGMLPGGGAALASFASYACEKKVSRYAPEMGKGAVEGLAGPESANNAAAQTSFIPLLTLGIPSNAVMALMMGAMILHSIQPSPLIITKEPALFWGLITSMWVGNLILVVLNLPLIGIWVMFLKVPYKYLFGAILVFCSIGVYSVSSSVFDIYVMVFFGLVGYVLLKLDCEPAPLLLGFVLGPMMEENFRRSLLISGGDYGVFVGSAISIVLLAVAVILAVIVAVPAIRGIRQEAFQEE